VRIKGPKALKLRPIPRNELGSKSSFAAEVQIEITNMGSQPYNSVYMDLSYKLHYPKGILIITL
jgi:hypothetical protein